MDYADRLIAKSRNNVNHRKEYTHRCRCWGKCFEDLKKGIKPKIIDPIEQELEDILGDREIHYGPWKEFLVKETGIWTTIRCPECGYSEHWSIGDGDERF